MLNNRSLENVSDRPRFYTVTDDQSTIRLIASEWNRLNFRGRLFVQFSDQ